MSTDFEATLVIYELANGNDFEFQEKITSYSNPKGYTI
jgi:hypothetical protein